MFRELGLSIFCLPGGAAIPFFDCFSGLSNQTDFNPHEQGATHMADGYARVTGKPGVVLVTSGPGATNTVTGIMTAHDGFSAHHRLTGQTISTMLGKRRFSGIRHFRA